jgi:anti-sigma B factor antagonist
LNENQLGQFGQPIMSLQRNGRTAVLAVSGEFDLSSIERFEQELERADGTAELVIDLSELSFMDSSALRALLKVDASAREEGFELTIVPGPVAQRLLELTGLDQKLPLSETRPSD